MLHSFLKKWPITRTASKMTWQLIKEKGICADRGTNDKRTAIS